MKSAEREYIIKLGRYLKQKRICREDAGNLLWKLATSKTKTRYNFNLNGKSVLLPENKTD